MYMKRTCAVAIFSDVGGAIAIQPGPATDGGGIFLFHGTEIRGYSQKIRGYSLECPGGLTTSMLIHILICDIGSVFWTLPPNSARQNNRLYYFIFTPPPRRRQRRAAPLHFTPLSYFTASPCIKCHRKGAFFFSFVFFCSRDDYMPVDAPQRDASYGC